MPTFKEFADSKYVVKMRKPEKYKKINPKSNRMKTFRKTRYLSTDIAPEKRTLENMPKYSTGISKVTAQEWLGIEDASNGYGKAKNGKVYGWSHRAIYGFKAGDKITGDNLGKKVKYGKYTAADVKAAEDAAKGEVAILPVAGETNFDNASYEDDFTIRDEAHAFEVAARFHDNVS